MQAIHTHPCTQLFREDIHNTTIGIHSDLVIQSREHRTGHQALRQYQQAGEGSSEQEQESEQGRGGTHLLGPVSGDNREERGWWEDVRDWEEL